GGVLPDQPDGRARVPCGEGFAAYASDTIYRLQGSHAHVQLTPPPAAGHLEAYAQLLILSDVAGTQIVFEVDAATNLLLMAVHVDHNDANVFTPPHDPVAPALLRIRESASILAWDPRPDARQRITRHTARARLDQPEQPQRAAAHALLTPRDRRPGARRLRLLRQLQHHPHPARRVHRRRRLGRGRRLRRPLRRRHRRRP